MHLGDTPHDLKESDFESLARKTEGFSGSDIAVCVSLQLLIVLDVQIVSVAHIFLGLRIDANVFNRLKMSYLSLYAKHKMQCSSLRHLVAHGCHVDPSNQVPSR